MDHAILRTLAFKMGTEVRWYRATERSSIPITPKAVNWPAFDPEVLDYVPGGTTAGSEISVQVIFC
jgi:hypothetical protein